MSDFLMPSLGADMEDGILAKWMKKPGELVKRGDVIAEVETQKGTIEIEVFEEGRIDSLLIDEGTRVPVGTPMARIQTGVSAKEPAQLSASPPEAKEITRPAVVPFIKTAQRFKASPLARRIAAENQIDLSLISGSGTEGAITKQDVERFIDGMPQKTKDETKFTKPAATEGIRAAVAAAMSRSNREIPHYYLEKTIDMSNAMAWLQNRNRERPPAKRLLPAAMLMKAMALSLREVPQLNATWDNGLQVKSEINVGFVIALRNGGIIVPAIAAADQKSVDDIMTALNDVIPRARALKLRSSELSDSTITMTSIGEGGSDSVFGVIYPPQVAIVGFGSISEQPYARNGMLGIHPLLKVTLAGDHRATDGLTGNRFLQILDKHLQKTELL